MLSSGCFVSVDGKGNLFVGLLGLKNQIVQIKVTLQSLPVASLTLQSLADCASPSGSSHSLAFQHALLSPTRSDPCTR